MDALVGRLSLVPGLEQETSALQEVGRAGITGPHFGELHHVGLAENIVAAVPEAGPAQVGRKRPQQLRGGALTRPDVLRGLEILPKCLSHGVVVSRNFGFIGRPLDNPAQPDNDPLALFDTAQDRP